MCAMFLVSARIKTVMAWNCLAEFSFDTMQKTGASKIPRFHHLDARGRTGAAPMPLIDLVGVLNPRSLPGVGNAQ
jgi:hypothetical protein